jgi:hypothetical protein
MDTNPTSLGVARSPMSLQVPGLKKKSSKFHMHRITTFRKDMASTFLEKLSDCTSETVGQELFAFSKTLLAGTSCHRIRVYSFYK